MKHKRSVAAALAVWGLALLLAGCSGWSYQPPMRGNESLALYNLRKLREATPATPTSFTQALTSDYASVAGSLQDELHDWADTD